MNILTLLCSATSLQTDEVAPCTPMPVVFELRPEVTPIARQGEGGHRRKERDYG